MMKARPRQPCAVCYVGRVWREGGTCNQCLRAEIKANENAPSLRELQQENQERIRRERTST